MDINVEIHDFIINALEWIATNGLSIALVLLFAEIISHFTGRLINRFVKHLLRAKKYRSEQDRKQRAKTLNRIFITGARVFIWSIAFIIVLVQLGVNVTAIVAGAGFFGLAFGIGAQNLINDITSGIFMVIENQYRVGDFVELNGVSGKVEDITMRITRIRSLDGDVHYIPNGEIKLATNKSMEFSKLNMYVGVSYDTDIDKAEKVINEVGLEMMKDSEWRDKLEEAPKFSRVTDFGDSAVELRVIAKVKAGKQWSTAGEFRRRIKVAFEKNKIVIPFPQRDVHMKK